MCLGAAAAHHRPAHQNDHGTDDRADQSRTFAGPIPSQCLAQERGYEGADDAEDCSEYEAAGSFEPGDKNFAMMPATKPMMIVQTIPIDGLGA